MPGYSELAGGMFEPTELPSMVSQALKSERDTIDRRLEVLLNEVNKLRTLRNSKTLINSKLPPEILSTIFCMANTKSLYLSGAKPSLSPGLLSWIKCTSHVCKYWRSIALSNPSLWVGGLPKNVDGIRTFLERSADLPIILDPDTTTAMQSSPQLCSLILPHMRRVQELYIKALQSDESVIRIILDRDLPYLRVLDLRTSAYHIGENSCIEIPRPAILKNVRSLRLSSAGFRWDCVEMRNLTTLQLDGKLPISFRPTVKQILDVLKLSPGLQILELRHVIQGDTDDDSQPQGTITADIYLPELSTLVLATDGTALAETLVRPTVLPKLESLNIKISTNDELKMVSVLRAFARALNYQPLSDIDFSELEYQEARILSVCAYNISHDQKFLFVSTWDHYQSFDLPKDILSSVNEFNFNSLTRFQCDIRQPLSKQWWRDVLGLAPVLKALHTEGLENPGGLISALTPEHIGGADGFLRNRFSTVVDMGTEQKLEADNGDSLEVTASTQKPIIFLPALSKLTFVDATFAFSSYRWHTDGAPYNYGSLDHLAYCLKQRMDHGFMQNALRLLGIPDTQIESGVHLGKYVKDLRFEDDTFDW